MLARTSLHRTLILVKSTDADGVSMTAPRISRKARDAKGRTLKGSKFMYRKIMKELSPSGTHALPSLFPQWAVAELEPLVVNLYVDGVV